ncbi:Hypothetical predicted protein [Xyrichtys novacula]|uniref:Uncharacterized protein n=1 Tax=Xyrichtys novacula TaxID=13765 RepID=A0AAV1H718_XYRNO|nr:Hypothetical predicted protein [Xyrichtys novacula]
MQTTSWLPSSPLGMKQASKAHGIPPFCTKPCLPSVYQLGCYEDVCTPYVCQFRSLSETWRGEEEGGEGTETPIHVCISLWMTEHLRPEDHRFKAEPLELSVDSSVFGALRGFPVICLPYLEHSTLFQL